MGKEDHFLYTFLLHKNTSRILLNLVGREEQELKQKVESDELGKAR